MLRIQQLGIRFQVRKRKKATSLRSIFNSQASRTEDFWALRGLDLECGEGETIGILGRNGAGKTTLCSTIAGILTPDEGRVEVRGRVVPLLSLGVGLNPQLSGQENILLVGSLLGVSQKRLRRLTPEILSFAELEAFADNPVKTYSSGMQSRLAFSIATCVEPDVLLLDEVLSVGDAGFRDKSRQRMQELQERARLVMVVSHSTQLLREVCTRAVWLGEGKVVADGSVDEVLDAYEGSLQIGSVNLADARPIVAGPVRRSD